jgi:beta-lactamase regulating signal transducer with metallopeptidase domain
MVEWAVSSAVLAAAFIVLRYALRGRIGLRLQYALWGLVLARLLVPVSFGSSAISVMNALPEQTAPVVTPAPAAMLRTPVPEGTAAVSAPPGETRADNNGTPSPIADMRETHSPRAEPAAAAPAAPRDGARLLQLVWLLGTCLVFLWFLGVNIRFALRLRRTRRPYAVPGDYPLPVYVARAAETTCLFGLFRPAVYLAPDAAEGIDLEHILAHELTHYRHGDQVWSLLRGLALALHWFDPLVWWAAALSRRDGELACDEGTLRRLGDGRRAEYGLALLRMTCGRRPNLFRAATTVTGSGRGLRERIKLIAKKPRTTALALVLVILLSALAVGCTFTGAKKLKTASSPKLAEDGRIILTVGAFQRDSSVDPEKDQLSWTRLNKAVDRFNAGSKEYLVEIRNYGDAASPESQARLDAEVLAGDMPDMLATWGMPENSYAQKGLLLDLYQWYDRELFFAGPLRSMETEGRLYSVSSSIEVFSFYGLESVLGQAAGYGLEDIYGAWESIDTGENAFIPQMGGAYVFLILSSLRMDEWLDPAAGTCRFDSPEFLSLLEFCRKLPAEAAVTQSEASAQGLTRDKMNALCVKNRDALLGWMFIAGEVGSVVSQYAHALTPLEGERIVNVGVPGISPAAAGCVSELPIAVSARSGSPEGARAFLDSLWDLGYVQVHEGELRSIPLMRSVLEEHIRDNTFTDKNGEEYAAFSVGPNAMPCSDAVIGGFLTMVESASVPMSADAFASISPIVLEEAMAFFGGTQSAPETAANIQRRYELFFEQNEP